jgi:hypothetical protein
MEPPRSNGLRATSSRSESSPCSRRSSRATFAVASRWRRRSEASRSRTCCATSTRSCCRERRTGRARGSSPTSPTAPPSRASSRSFSLPRSTRSRSSGARRRHPPSSRPLTLDWVAQLLGLPSGWHGHIEDTASISTIAALAAARASNGGRVVVCSEEAHSSVERAARLLGLETRKVPLDDEFRLDASALDLTDAAALVATVGTTSTTAVDPVPALAAACEAAGVWLHVDAAYAGSAWVCPELRWSQAGVERTDSLVVNAHKWLFHLPKRAPTKRG